MISYSSYKRIFYAFCIYDIVALLPLFIPYINNLHIATLDSFNQSLGGMPFGEFTLVHMLFLQMLGLVGTGWAVWRLRHFSLEIGRFEGLLRLAFSGLFFSASIKMNMPLLFILFAVDLAGGFFHSIKPKSN